MQRSSINQKSLTHLAIYFFAFMVYESFYTIYPFLPPLFGILFYFFVKSLENEDSVSLAVVLLCLIIFESTNGYALFSSIMYLFLAYKFILPKIIQNFNCYSCVKFSYVFLSYFGFYFVNALIANIFLLPMPDLSYMIIYYIVIEFLIVSLV